MKKLRGWWANLGDPNVPVANFVAQIHSELGIPKGGLENANIDQLEKEDLPTDLFLWQGWRTGAHRTDHWAVAIGCSLVGEGEKLKPEGIPEWNRETEIFASKMRGALVPPDILDLATRERNAFRAQHPH